MKSGTIPSSSTRTGSAPPSAGREDLVLADQPLLARVLRDPAPSAAASRGCADCDPRRGSARRASSPAPSRRASAARLPARRCGASPPRSRRGRSWRRGTAGRCPEATWTPRPPASLCSRIAACPPRDRPRPPRSPRRRGAAASAPVPQPTSRTELPRGQVLDDELRSLLEVVVDDVSGQRVVVLVGDLVEVRTRSSRPPGLWAVVARAAPALGSCRGALKRSAQDQQDHPQPDGSAAFEVAGGRGASDARAGS